PPDHRTDRSPLAAPLNGAGLAHAHLPGRGAPGLRSLAPRAPRDRRDTGVPRRDSLCVARVLTPVPLDPGAPPARLPPLPRRERPYRARGPDVRPRQLARRALPDARRPI